MFKICAVLFLLFIEIFLCFSKKDSTLLSDTAIMAIKVDAVPSPVDLQIWTEYETGVASWYGIGDGFQGKKTANGERFDTYDFTGAHKKLKFGSVVRVTNLENGKSVVVRINDRGPYVRGRVIDLSHVAMKQIAGSSGLCKVKLELLKIEK